MKLRYFAEDFGPVMAFLIGALFVAGCGARAQKPPPIAAPNAPATVAPSPQPGTVPMSQLQPAQGHLAPGILIYDEFGDVEGRVIKVEPNFVFKDGTPGGVLFNWDDDRNSKTQYLPFKMFDHWFVLKN